MASVTHISEAEALSNLPRILARAQAGEEFVVDVSPSPVTIRSAYEQPTRSIAESIALAKANEAELGYAPAMDSGFAADLETILRSRSPRKSIDE